jgi:branched-chain amino acid transport system ATP-binding protein
LLAVDGLVAGYGRTEVLRGLSLSVAPGELVAVLGANGVGKTTLLRAIMGMVRPRAGTVRFEGTDLTGRRPEEIVRHGLALVPEGRRVFSMLTVRENLLLASRSRGRGREVAEDLEVVFEIFPVLRERAGAHGDQLSGGQQQMVALGRAIMQRPRLVLMDEPSIGLSPLIVQQLPRMIQRVQERTGASVLLVEQDAGVALSLAARGYVLRGGSVALEASGDELAHSDVLLESYLGSGAHG